MRGADQLSYAEIEKALKVFAEKARNGTISIDDCRAAPHDHERGRVRLHALDADFESAAERDFGHAHIVNRPVVLRKRDRDPADHVFGAECYDHRIVDGKESISFLMHIKKNLEEPARLLLDL